MNSMKRDKKDEEEGGGGGLFSSLDKTTVLQEARLFNETPVNPRKCTQILTKILYLLMQGEELGTREATDTFFAMTKLFQSKDIVLRRMVYLGIKELSTVAEDVIIVTSSLTKDMTGKEDLYRAAAIRALCSITDSSMLQSIERYMKQAIVDKSPSVSSAGLVSSLHLMASSGEIIRRWVNEAQEAANSDNMLVQYHAIGLLYAVRKTDRLAVIKLVSKYTSLAVRSPFATCMLIRIACRLMEDDPDNDSTYQDFLESCLRHKSEMVIYEAAHAIVNLKRTGARELSPAVSVLQLFCSSPKATLRFAAVRTLNKVAMRQPTAVTACNLDLENLISDSNRSVATLAITTLLKTGAESSIDRLMKQIASFVSEISDEFKVVVVQAIRALCVKFPRKHGVLMTFLSSLLREEGGLDYKAAIADTLITIIEENPEAKETGLAHLCEFIEDCEHTALAVRILHLLGKEGPRTNKPSRYIRFIYNRVILENACVRAAAVSALARFGALVDELTTNILVLLCRCEMDSDDEVRDRAAYYRCILENQDRSLSSHFILNEFQEGEGEPREGMLMTEKKPSAVTKTRQETLAQQLLNIPALAALPLGQLFKSSMPTDLTESETEYVVQCIKHVFPQHVVLQFECRNTLPDQLLENVRISLEIPAGFELVSEIPCPRLEYNTPGNVYSCIRLPDDPQLAMEGTFEATMKFVVKDCDPNTGLPDSDYGYDDEYIVRNDPEVYFLFPLRFLEYFWFYLQLEEVEVATGDFLVKVIEGDFQSAWDGLGEENQVTETFELPYKSLEEAVTKIVKFLSLHPSERSDRVQAGKTTHTLYLSVASLRFLLTSFL
ncbi:unnamed protein product [Darwinula stevensoni]|uniref:Coatomer subunit gamma n=1 Tax=Darwinula stevensoni TaxID=69355 RepID=A0A7R8XIP8_9CRUS|nr:unnamed protein product [Darwinula stevensoni]CAG0894487.1 unnamed protein product [Darwinula stevensoni]